MPPHATTTDPSPSSRNFLGLAGRRFQDQAAAHHQERLSRTSSSDGGLSSSTGTSLSEIVRRLRGTSPISSPSSRDIMGGIAGNNSNDDDDWPASSAYDHDVRSSESVSSLSQISTTTDAILLSDPRIGGSGSQILALEPPQPDEASIEQPLRPLRTTPKASTTENDSEMVEIPLGSQEQDNEAHAFEPNKSSPALSPRSEGNDENPNSWSSSLSSWSFEDGCSSRRLWLLIGLVVVLAAVAVVVPLVVISDDGSDNRGSTPNQQQQQPSSPTTSISTPSPTTAPTVSPTLFPSTSPSRSPSIQPSTIPSVQPSLGPSSAPTALSTLVFAVISESVPDSAALIINDPTSPQARAFDWLVDNINLQEHSKTRILQRYALAVFYYSTNGDQWTDNTGWLELEDECDWYNEEVSPCSSRKELIFLNLPQNNLSGMLNDELGVLLPFLVEIVLFKNPSLGGPIPSTFGDFKLLEILDLSETNISGNIPPELGNAFRLQKISLTNTQVQGQVPASLGQLVFLDELLLIETSLSGPMPEEICARDLSEVWADCDRVSPCNCCTFCCYNLAVAFCTTV